MFTTLLRDDVLFYVLAVAPRDCVADYETRQVIRSIEDHGLRGVRAVTLGHRHAAIQAVGDHARD